MIDKAVQTAKVFEQAHIGLGRSIGAVSTEERQLFGDDRPGSLANRALNSYSSLLGIQGPDGVGERLRGAVSPSTTASANDTVSVAPAGTSMSSVDRAVTTGNSIDFRYWRAQGRTRRLERIDSEPKRRDLATCVRHRSFTREELLVKPASCRLTSIIPIFAGATLRARSLRQPVHPLSDARPSRPAV